MNAVFAKVIFTSLGCIACIAVSSLPAAASTEISPPTSGDVQEDPILRTLKDGERQKAKIDALRERDEYSRIERMELNRNVQEDPLLSEVRAQPVPTEHAPSAEDSDREDTDRGKSGVIPIEAEEFDLGSPEEVEKSSVGEDAHGGDDSSDDVASKPPSFKKDIRSNDSSTRKQERKDRKVQEDPLLKAIERREDH